MASRLPQPTTKLPTPSKRPLSESINASNIPPPSHPDFGVSTTLKRKAAAMIHERAKETAPSYGNSLSSSTMSRKPDNTRRTNPLATSVSQRPESRSQSRMTRPESRGGPTFGPGKRPAWDTKGRLEDMESMYTHMETSYQNMENNYTNISKQLEGSNVEREKIQEMLNKERDRYYDLQERFAESLKDKIQAEGLAENAKMKIISLETAIDDERSEQRNQSERLHTRFEEQKELSRKEHQMELSDLNRKHKDQLIEMGQKIKAEIEHERKAQMQAIEEMKDQFSSEKTLLKEFHQKEINAQLQQLEKVKVEAAKDREITTNAHAQELESQRQILESAITKHNEEKKEIFAKHEKEANGYDLVAKELEHTKATLARETKLNEDFKSTLSEQSASQISLEAVMRNLRIQIETLENKEKAYITTIETLESSLTVNNLEKQDMSNKLRSEELVRRKLHNQIQELKGNIRVFCRFRPVLSSEHNNGEIVPITYPDIQAEGREVVLEGLSSETTLGSVMQKSYNFAFDKVFTPKSTNEEVFDEVEQLVQSSLDGYNVCIFAYGQTGSGKTHTMSAADGMIPRAVRKIFDTAVALKQLDWDYTMEGQFLEIYNETINDLLGKVEEFDKKKHDIRHDTVRQKTTVTDLTSVEIESQSKLEYLLKKASNNRSVAATKANERSSRSHSVFILKLRGQNQKTGEISEGILNLIDLAGSERLSHSQSTGERLKETQAINKSLSCLGDVIGALGSMKEGSHIPYRNSKLTYLLQYSLGGNSKTLMYTRLYFLLFLLIIGL